MKITPIRAHKITTKDSNLLKVLDRYLPELKEGCVVVITSKIVSICEGNTVLRAGIEKHELVASEADFVLETENKERFTITMKNDVLMPTAGIDPYFERYIMLPKNAQRTAQNVARHLRKKYGLEKLGVLITDSKSIVLRRGTLGYAVGYSGFSGLKNYDNPDDLFLEQKKRKKLVNRVDALAAAGVAVMGEGREQTPLAIIEDIPFLDFNELSPTNLELETLHVKPENDLFISSFPSLGKKKTKQTRVFK